MRPMMQEPHIPGRAARPAAAGADVLVLEHPVVPPRRISPARPVADLTLVAQLAASRDIDPPGAGGPGRRPGRALRRIGLALAGGLVLAAVSVSGTRHEQGHSAVAAVAPSAAQLAVPVQMAAVESATTTAARRFVGRVEALHTVDIAFQLPGQMIELLPAEGDRVAVGTPLARLDPEDYRLALAHAEAVRALAEAEHDRVVELVGRNVAPTAQLDRVRAELRQAEVAVERAARALEQTVIHAPFEALVARRLTEAWANITPAMPVLRLQDVSTLLVAISLPEDLAAWARTEPEAFEAVARFPAAPDLALPLEPQRFVTEADPVAQTFGVKLALRGSDPRILPGMTATVEVRPRAAPQEVLVPVSAIDTTGGSVPQVWVVGSDGTVRARALELGLPQGERIAVRTGLAPGERIVAAGWRRLEDGMRVRPAAH